MKKLCYLLIFGLTVIEKMQSQFIESAVYENVMNEKGYHFSYKTTESERREKGVFEQASGEKKLAVVRGFYSFISTDGKKYQVNFVADKNGYRPLVKVKEEGTSVRKPQLDSQRSANIVPYVGSAVLGSLIGGGLG